MDGVAESWPWGSTGKSPIHARSKFGAVIRVDLCENVTHDIRMPTFGIPCREAACTRWISDCLQQSNCAPSGSS